mmetsp:Transcript_16251/g.35234  ORF Transcript_16251/g.35234 Transcript_16251/m.35234 type:complete len:133 (+) Transcript_16251:521-919(+)
MPGMVFMTLSNAAGFVIARLLSCDGRLESLESPWVPRDIVQDAANCCKIQPAFGDDGVAFATSTTAAVSTVAAILSMSWYLNQKTEHSSAQNARSTRELDSWHEQQQQNLSKVSYADFGGPPAQHTIDPPLL